MTPSNPVTQFEESARTIWRSELSADEKGKRLKSVRAAILHYVVRLDQKQGTNANDPWASRSFDRARSYLKLLAADVEELSLECERSTSKPKKPAGVPGAYAA